ncbi:MAG: glycosyl transferase [Pseudanabaenaceae cyanobacterium]
MKAICFAMTNHGFGHTTRTASVMAAVHALRPDLPQIAVTTAPRWLLDSYLRSPYTYHPQAWDVGVIQADSFTLDRSTTLARWQDFQQATAQRVTQAVAFLHAHNVQLLVADMPPLAAVIAEAAGIPCWFVGNFGWDFIYRDWGGPFCDLADALTSQYQRGDRLFRLPFHEPMATFANVTDVGFTGGSPRYEGPALRSRLGLAADRPTALLTFGGLGLQGVPYQNLASFPDWQFLTFDRDAPTVPNLFPLCGRDLRPVDVLPLCDRLVAKPGYSTLSEACRLAVPTICLTRENFAEAPFLLQGLQQWNAHRIVRAQDFYQRPWDFLTAPLIPAIAPETRPDRHGEKAIAAAIVDFLAGV